MRRFFVRSDDQRLEGEFSLLTHSPHRLVPNAAAQQHEHQSQHPRHPDPSARQIGLRPVRRRDDEADANGHRVDDPSEFLDRRVAINAVQAERAENADPDRERDQTQFEEAVSDELIIRPKRRRRDRMPVLSENAVVISVVVGIFVLLLVVLVVTW